MNQTFLFYDIETSGLNKCFDQILQFAAIRTDLELNELERYNFFVKLNPDVVPSPQAILTHKISLTKLAQEGISEYAAAKLIHQLCNTPFTISVGYNSLGFDDEFLRFTFYRNLLEPYTHQYNNGCYRMDLYPITTLYYLFHNEILNWPKIVNAPTLKLEHLCSTNELAPKDMCAHDAITDVIATLGLARHLHKKADIWQYVCGYFDKKKDMARYDKLNIGLNVNGFLYPDAILIDGCIGAKNNYQTIGLSLGWHRHYSNQLLWLDLCKTDFAANITMSNIATTTTIYRKKYGEPPLTLPTRPNLLRHISSDRYALVKKNLEWLYQNQQIFQAIINYHQNYIYPIVTNLDIDAALYQDGFLCDNEKQTCLKFHAVEVQEKINWLEKFTKQKLRTQALRLLGRNYFNELPSELRTEFTTWLTQLNAANNVDGDNENIANLITRDYRNEPRLTAKQALNELKQLQIQLQLKSQIQQTEQQTEQNNNNKVNNMDDNDKQQMLLAELEEYYSSKI